MLGTYQYILSPPEEIDEEDEDTLLGVLQKLMTPSMDTSNPTAEKFCVTTLKSVITGKNSEDIMVYGITDDSAILVCRTMTARLPSAFLMDLHRNMASASGIRSP